MTDIITFVIPSRNNLDFLKLAIPSLRALKRRHYILVLDDASTDNTIDWLTALDDDHLLIYRNPGPERIGIVGMFDKGIDMAPTERICAFHADMVAAPHLDDHMLKHSRPGVVVTATRVEPPLHPEGPEKIIKDFGLEADEFKKERFFDWALAEQEHTKDKTTEGIFAPWCMYKNDFLAMGGHDDFFAPQSKEDSDLFNRFYLHGYTFIQARDAFVYHFTSRGSRFNTSSGGAAGKNSDEWKRTNHKNTRNFIRKWGQMVNHDAYLKPLVPHRYHLGIVLQHTTLHALETLEPYADCLYLDTTALVATYIEREQPLTLYPLAQKFYDRSAPIHTDIVLTLDGRYLGRSIQFLLSKLPELWARCDAQGLHHQEVFLLPKSTLILSKGGCILRAFKRLAAQILSRWGLRASIGTLTHYDTLVLSDDWQRLGRAPLP